MENNNKIEFPVLKVRQPIGEFFIASMPAKQVAAISYSDVRRMSRERDIERYLGVQRPLKEARVNAIQEYARSLDATFPTAVILSIDEKCVEFNEENNTLILQEYHSMNSDEKNIPFGKIAKVLDGQHRIAGFTEKGNNQAFDFENFEDKPFDLNVAIFIGADLPVQANIFATVNLAQTKVNKSLAYDLYALSETDSPYKLCHEVAMILDQVEESPLFERIKRLGVKTPGRDNKEPLTLQSFVEALLKFISAKPMQDRNDILDGKKILLASDTELQNYPFRNYFLRGQSEVIAEILFNYFLAVEKKWPDAWNAVNTTGNLLPKANAFKALMRFLKTEGLYRASGEDSSTVPSVDRFFKLFEEFSLTDNDFDVSNLPPGSGGESKFFKYLSGEISSFSEGN